MWVPCEAFVYVEAEVLYYVRGGQRDSIKEDWRTETFIEGEDNMLGFLGLYFYLPFGEPFFYGGEVFLEVLRSSGGIFVRRQDGLVISV